MLQRWRGGVADAPHPWDARITVWHGWYIEEVFELLDGGGFRSHLVEHTEDDAFELRAEHIHRIVEVAPGGVWTMAKYRGPAVQPIMFYDFSGPVIRTRPWYQSEFT